MSRSFVVSWILVCCWLAVGPPVVVAEVESSQPSFGIALLSDGPARQAGDWESVFRREIEDLADGEIDVRFVPFVADWTRDGILQTLDRAFADPSIDLVLVTGVVANQVILRRRDLTKPTFLPLIFDGRLLELPRAGKGSGRENLSYLADELDFAADLESFLSLTKFRRLGLLVDDIILVTVGQVTTEVELVTTDAGIELVPIPYADTDQDLTSLIPDDVDAVMIDGLERVSSDSVERLIQGLIERQLPSFSLAGVELVHRGLLTSDTQDSEVQRLARRIALNMQAVMLGEPAAEQPVDFSSKRRLVINMRTARQIDVWPSYALLVEASLIGGELGQDALPESLVELAREALSKNLDLLAEAYGVDAGAEDIRTARASLLPQITSAVTTTQLDGANAGVVSGAAARTSASGTVTASQLLWSENARANVAIQHHLQDSRLAELEAFRLDTLQAATVAFLEILTTDTQFRIQRDNLERTRTNLELATDRVRVGSSSAADVYRWQSELATARQDTINAHATRVRARESLNQVLHRPLTDPLNPIAPTLGDEGIFASPAEMDALLDNPKGMRVLTDLLVARGLESAPELRSLRAGIDAQRRQLKSNRRVFYLPDVALQGQVSQILFEDRFGEDVQEGEFDWNLSLNATLSLFEGGARSSRVAQAELELQQLETRYLATTERIEQNIRSNMHLLDASFNNISLAQDAAEASKNNLELVTDSYAEGAVNILQMLDAQSAALQAEAAASTASFTFLINLMNVHRAVGSFDLLLDAAERQALVQQMTTLIAQRLSNGNN